MAEVNGIKFTFKLDNQKLVSGSLLTTVQGLFRGYALNNGLSPRLSSFFPQPSHAFTDNIVTWSHINILLATNIYCFIQRQNVKLPKQNKSIYSTTYLQYIAIDIYIFSILVGSSFFILFHSSLICINACRIERCLAKLTGLENLLLFWQK